MLDVIFTSDYEIHGSGRGSPRRLMVEPTARMLDQFDRYGAKLTIMADVAEIFRYQQYAEETGEDRFSFGAIRDQLQATLGRGHDVQLHIHFAYYGARYEDGYWKPNDAENDLAQLGYERQEAIIREAKAFLEKMLRPARPDYVCKAFRAGGWSMRPSRNIVRALVANGIEIDTSVFKYGKRNGKIRFDYSDAHSALVPWPVDEEDVSRAAPGGRLLEFPIYCENRSVLRFLTVNRLYRVVLARLNRRPSSAPGEIRTGNGPVDSPSKFRKLWRIVTQPQAWKLDFNQCSGRQLVAGLERAYRRYDDRARLRPVVLIGHSKLFTAHNERSLAPFLEHVASRPDRYRFGTFDDFDLESIR